LEETLAHAKSGTRALITGQKQDGIVSFLLKGNPKMAVYAKSKEEIDSFFLHSF
jgi:hypothetical protein